MTSRSRQPELAHDPVDRFFGQVSRLRPLSAVWLSVVVVSVFAPDMVTGSEREHLPIAAMTVWLWGAVATAYLLLTPDEWSTVGWATGVAGVWLAVLLVSVASPEMVTGSGPPGFRSGCSWRRPQERC
jgi:hypothetical protein